MTDKEKCIQFHKWVQSLHKSGFPKVFVEGKAFREMTIDELYDHYSNLTESQKRGFVD